MKGRWSEVRIAGHSCDLYEPPQRNVHGYVLLYLHGVHLGKLHDKQQFLAAFDRHGLPVIAPMTGPSWWTDQICPAFDPNISAERHVLSNVLPFIAQQYQATPPQIALLGTSMGGQGALRLAYKYPDTFPVVAALAPAIDFHLRLKEGDPVLAQMYGEVEKARQDTAVLHIRALNWPRHQFFCCDPTDERWWDGADRLHMKLAALGIPHQYDLETRAGGHGFEYYSQMADRAIDFIAHALERERLRVV